MMFEVDNGLTNTPSAFNATLPVMCFTSIALYNVIELTFIIFITFKKKSGLYFWSFWVATWGIAPYSLGFLLKGLGIAPNATYVFVTMIVLGWSCMVTGQSVVLYSRLHLVDRSRKRLRMVLAMIITNAIICHLPIAVMIFGSNSSNPDPFVMPYTIYEKVQVTIFFIQELIISGLYITATVRFFRHSALHARSSRKRMLHHLVLVNIVVILLDITILGLEYAGMYTLQTAYKGMVYSIKLKLEFNILNELIDLTRGRTDTGSYERDYGQEGDPSGGGGNNQTTVDGAGRNVALDTIERTGRSQLKNKDQIRTRKGGASPDIADIADHGYSAYIRTENSNPLRDTKGRTPNDGIMVMTTTEVNVSEEMDRSGRVVRRLSSADGISAGGSGVTSEDQVIKSSSSSEIGFAKSGA